MIKIKILVVEDKMIVAEDIKEMLESMGHYVTGIATTSEMAIKTYLKEKPDIIFMDIRLRGDIDGIETSRIINEIDPVPIIFLTAHSDLSTLTSAMQTSPENYIVKPFDLKDLRIAVELALSKNNGMFTKEFLTYRHNGMLERIPIKDILFARANGSYTIIYTAGRKYTASFNLAQFQKKLTNKFLRIHRSYIVQSDKIERYTSSKLFIATHEIPISRSYRKNLFN